MNYVWVITHDDLLDFLDLVYSGEMTPEEVVDRLHLGSQRDYFTRDEEGGIVELDEEEAFRRELE